VEDNDGWVQRVHEDAVHLMGIEIETFWRFNEFFTTLVTVVLGLMVTGFIQFSNEFVFLSASSQVSLFMIYLCRLWKQGNKKVDARIESLIVTVTEIGRGHRVSLFSERVAREYGAELSEIFRRIAIGFQILWSFLFVATVLFAYL